jgi:hypothetical protein
MKRLLYLGLLAALVAAPGSAADLNARLYVAHGIDGSDLGFPTDLPVDVCTAEGVDALLSDVPFKTITPEPLVLPPGKYDIQIRVADGSGGCTGPLAVAATLYLSATENSTAIAHLTEQGTPTLTKFVNDVRALGVGQTRVYARHTAAAGDVNVYLRNGRGRTVISGLENPEQEGADLRAGTYDVSIYPDNPSKWSRGDDRERKPLFSKRLDLAAGTAYFAYAVGSPAEDSFTFTVLLQPIVLK